MYLSQFNRDFLILLKCSKSEQSIVKKTDGTKRLFFDILFADVATRDNTICNGETEPERNGSQLNLDVDAVIPQTVVNHANHGSSAVVTGQGFIERVRGL